MCNRYEILLKCDLFVCQTLRTVSEGYRMLSAVTTLMSQISGDINTSQRLISFSSLPQQSQVLLSPYIHFVCWAWHEKLECSSPFKTMTAQNFFKESK